MEGGCSYHDQRGAAWRARWRADLLLKGEAAVRPWGPPSSASSPPTLLPARAASLGTRAPAAGAADAAGRHAQLHAGRRAVQLWVGLLAGCSTWGEGGEGGRGVAQRALQGLALPRLGCRCKRRRAPAEPAAPRPEAQPAPPSPRFLAGCITRSPARAARRRAPACCGRAWRGWRSGAASGWAACPPWWGPPALPSCTAVLCCPLVLPRCHPPPPSCPPCCAALQRRPTSCPPTPPSRAARAPPAAGVDGHAAAALCHARRVVAGRAEALHLRPAQGLV